MTCFPSGSPEKFQSIGKKIRIICWEDTRPQTLEKGHFWDNVVFICDTTLLRTSRELAPGFIIYVSARRGRRSTSASRFLKDEKKKRKRTPWFYFTDHSQVYCLKRRSYFYSIVRNVVLVAVLQEGFHFSSSYRLDLDAWSVFYPLRFDHLMLRCGKMTSHN